MYNVKADRVSTGADSTSYRTPSRGSWIWAGAEVGAVEVVVFTLPVEILFARLAGWRLFEGDTGLATAGILRVFMGNRVRG